MRRSTMKSRALVSPLRGATLLALLPGAIISLAAQNSPNPSADERAVRAANDRLQAAVLTSDTAAFSQLLAPEYLFITATGGVITRDDVLRRYAAKELAYTVYRADSVRRRLFGDAAVVPALLEREGRYVAGPRAGTELTGRYRSTRVYIRRGGRWQVVSTHESALGS